MFGSTSSSPAFGTPSSTPLFGTHSSSPLFGTPSSTPAFGTPATPGFATPATTPAFGAPAATPGFGTPSSTPGFGTPSVFGSGSSNFFIQQQQQQQQPSFGFNPSPSLLGNAQITTQMAPVAPLPLSLTDRDLLAIRDAYKDDDPGNPKYNFRHLLLSVTDPAARVKPVGASDIMWAEAMRKLEGMQSSDRERLWPQLVQGFKDLSNRLKIIADLHIETLFLAYRIISALLQLQDEVIVSDAERLRVTRSNIKMLLRHFQTDTIPWVQRLKQKEQRLQMRLLRAMRIVEALEGKGFRMPLTKGEVELGEKLGTISKQLKGSGAELSRRVHNLVNVARLQSNVGGSDYHPISARIDEQSLVDMQEVLQQQTEAISRLGIVLKRDSRDIEIIMPKGGTDMVEDAGVRRTY